MERKYKPFFVFLPGIFLHNAAVPILKLSCMDRFVYETAVPRHIPCPPEISLIFFSTYHFCDTPYTQKLKDPFPNPSVFIIFCLYYLEK